jgi:hypothetical protein
MLPHLVRHIWWMWSNDALGLAPREGDEATPSMKGDLISPISLISALSAKLIHFQHNYYIIMCITVVQIL